MLMKTDPKILEELEWTDWPEFDLSQPSLRGLSYILRHRELWPPDFEWNFSRGDNCAIGISFQTWGIEKGKELIDSVIYEGRKPIFASGEYLVANRDVTPEMVADRIDEYIARKV